MVEKDVCDDPSVLKENQSIVAEGEYDRYEEQLLKEEESRERRELQTKRKTSFQALQSVFARHGFNRMRSNSSSGRHADIIRQTTIHKQRGMRPLMIGLPAGLTASYRNTQFGDIPIVKLKGSDEDRERELDDSAGFGRMIEDQIQNGLDSNPDDAISEHELKEMSSSDESLLSFRMNNECKLNNARRETEHVESDDIDCNELSRIMRGHHSDTDYGAVKRATRDSGGLSFLP